MKFIVSLCFFAVAFSSVLPLTIARGGYRSSVPSGLRNENYGGAGSARFLFEEKESQTSVDVAQGYMTNSDLEKAVKEFGRRCSNISRVYSIGKSVNGVPLWVMEISDHPGEREAEPAFKFIGNVHGDEPVGRELLVLLANWICDNYINDPLAKLIVENIHLHILPSMNPDGFSLRRRGNANNIDLNRDFPDQFFAANDDEYGRQPESKAIMKWLREIHFMASATLHGALELLGLYRSLAKEPKDSLEVYVQGALVANYPWDGTSDKRRIYYACPDDETFRFMATVYSRSHYNMSLSKEFPGGITNGAAWYPVYGGMQDWNYIHGGCFELTLEISDNKWPNANELPTIWEYNKMSMLNLVASLVKTGVHGRIFSSDSGRPLPGAIIVKGINYTVQAGRGFADYHRLLAPGQKYEVMASVPGYKSKSTTIWLGDGAATLDFILDPQVTTVGTSGQRACDCDSGHKNKLLLIIWGVHLEVYLVILVVVALIFFLVKRRTKFNLVKNRPASKRLVSA